LFGGARNDTTAETCIAIGGGCFGNGVGSQITAAGIEHVSVAARSALQRIVACAASENVVAVVAVERIGTTATKAYRFPRRQLTCCHCYCGECVIATAAYDAGVHRIRIKPILSTSGTDGLADCY